MEVMDKMSQQSKSVVHSNNTLVSSVIYPLLCLPSFVALI
jgi:hypothetical protein